MKPLRSQSGRKGHPLAASFGGSLLQRHPHRRMERRILLSQTCGGGLGQNSAVQAAGGNLKV
jgi:hypothetical protein